MQRKTLDIFSREMTRGTLECYKPKRGIGSHCGAAAGGSQAKRQSAKNPSMFLMKNSQRAQTLSVGFQQAKIVCFGGACPSPTPSHGLTKPRSLLSMTVHCWMTLLDEVSRYQPNGSDRLSLQVHLAYSPYTEPSYTR